MSALLSFAYQQELVCNPRLPPVNQEGFIGKGMSPAPFTRGSPARQGLLLAKSILEGAQTLSILSCVKATCALRSDSPERQGLPQAEGLHRAQGSPKADQVWRSQNYTVSCAMRSMTLFVLYNTAVQLATSDNREVTCSITQ